MLSPRVALHFPHRFADRCLRHIPMLVRGFGFPLSQTVVNNPHIAEERIMNLSTDGSGVNEEDK